MPEHPPIAVHWGFASHQLIVRAIGRTGALTRHIETVSDIWLANASFTIDAKKLMRWRQGNVHARQFAEVRGDRMAAPPVDQGTKFVKVEFDPRKQEAFCLTDGTAIINARFAHLYVSEKRGVMEAIL